MDNRSSASSIHSTSRRSSAQRVNAGKRSSTRRTKSAAKGRYNVFPSKVTEALNDHYHCVQQSPDRAELEALITKITQGIPAAAPTLVIQKVQRWFRNKRHYERKKLSERMTKAVQAAANYRKIRGSASKRSSSTLPPPSSRRGSSK